MKNSRKRLFVVVLSLILVFTLLPTAALADSYSAGEITIDTSFTTGSLSVAVTAQHSTLTEITSLVITAGQLNNTDVYWIRDNLVNLTNLVISGAASVAGNALPANAFQSTSLETVYLENTQTLGDYAFDHCLALFGIELPQVTYVGEHAFEECDDLYYAFLPEVITIADYGFYSCEILVPEDMVVVTTIGEYAFAECDTMTELRAYVATSIGANAFNDCDNLAVAYLPAVVSIGDSAFRDCVLFDEIYPGAAVPTIGHDAFWNTAGTRTAGVPQSVAATYLADATDGNGADSLWHGWTISGLSEDDTLASLMTSEGNLSPVFSGATNIYTIIVPTTTTSIDITPTLTESNGLLLLWTGGAASIIPDGAPQTIALSGDTTEIHVIVYPQMGLDIVYRSDILNVYEITIIKSDREPNPETGGGASFIWSFVSLALILILAALLIRKKHTA